MNTPIITPVIIPVPVCNCSCHSCKCCSSAQGDALDMAWKGQLVAFLIVIAIVVYVIAFGAFTIDAVLGSGCSNAEYRGRYFETPMDVALGWPRPVICPAVKWFTTPLHGGNR